MDGSRRNQTPSYTGQQFGNYRIGRLIGQGGFADVYLGKHVFLDRQAAVKILHAGHRQTSVDLQAFLDEARIAAKLDHPHIIRVLDFGLEGQIPFLVMAYTRNGTVRQQYPHGSCLVPTILLKYVKEVAEAVQYIHEKGLIHRDIKPENMLLGPHNEVWLSDFGIAIAAHAVDDDEDELSVVGTATYMAPEQIDGRPCLNSDQYALAIVVYEWLFGYPPFRGSVNEIIYKHFHAKPPSLYASVPLVPQAVENVVFKALAKDPQERFESVQAFAAALENAFKPPPLVLRSNDPQRTRPQSQSQSQLPQPRSQQPLSGERQKQGQALEHPVARAGREQVRRAKSKGRKAWKETATFCAIDLLVSAALACVLAGTNVVPFLSELLLALCLVLLPLVGALIRRNNALFFLTCSIAVTAALATLIFHDLVFFIVISIGLLLLSLLTALTVIFSEM